MNGTAAYHLGESNHKRDRRLSTTEKPTMNGTAAHPFGGLFKLS